MPEAILEKESCLNCGVEVRPDTDFCYNCGKPIPLLPTDTQEADSEVDEKDASLADLERALAASRIEAKDPRSKIETAAAERRRARIGQRKPIEMIWDRPEPDANWVYLLSVGVIFVLVLLAVYLTVFWK